MKPKIIFLVPSITNSHYKNRILEFIDRGYDIEVYGFERSTHNKPKGIPYKYHIIGNIEDGSYISRIKLYRKKFAEIYKKHSNDKTIFYLCGLDIAMFFTMVNPKAIYIYEECDLVHTYTKLKHIFELIDKRIIRKSLLTITTSEGFIRYHFGTDRPENVCLVENKLNPDILNCKLLEKSKSSEDGLSIAFVGIPRFDSIYNFIDVFCRNYPQHTFHIWGGPVPEQFQPLSKYSNCHFHGFFNNPVDLPGIYSQTDLILATYDVKYDNVRYAEPNKLYESIYFETPIVVSKGTFLSDKVEEFGIGFSINPLDEDCIINFINNLSLDKVKYNVTRIEKEYAINNNSHLFNKLKALFETIYR